MTKTAKRSLLAFILILVVQIAAGQALTKPFKYLRPEPDTDEAVDDRKSPYLWSVFIDREGVTVYKDKNLRNDTDVQVGFMDRFIVVDETDESLLLFTDPNIDSTRLSDQAQEIGWVDKRNLVLWDRFMWGTEFTKLIGIGSWEMVNDGSSQIEPNTFSFEPDDDYPYYIFNIVKFDSETGDILISLRTFNSRSPEMFCWVSSDDLHLMNTRNGIIPNRIRIQASGLGKPTVYETIEGLQSEDINEIAIVVDSVRSEEGYIPSTGIVRYGINHVKWVDDGKWSEGFLELEPADDQVSFLHGILLNRQEFSKIKRSIDILAESESKDDMVARWKRLFTYYNVTLYEDLDQYALFEELVQIKFFHERNDVGTSFKDLPFITGDEFLELRQAFQEDKLRLDLVESDTDYPFNFAPLDYPHYWIPLEFLPLEALSVKFSRIEALDEVLPEDKWTYNEREVQYESFDFFYIENSHDYESSFELKDQAIKTFYRRAARIRESDPRRGSMVFLSNTQQPIVGSGETFTENVAGMMREGVTSRPNRHIDKKLIRSHLYARNITDVETLRFHFFVGNSFYSEAQRTNRWLMKELVNELHVEMNADKTEVILYSLVNIEDQSAFTREINAILSPEITYRVSVIKP